MAFLEQRKSQQTTILRSSAIQAVFVNLLAVNFNKGRHTLLQIEKAALTLQYTKQTPDAIRCIALLQRSATSLKHFMASPENYDHQLEVCSMGSRSHYSVILNLDHGVSARHNHPVRTGIILVYTHPDATLKLQPLLEMTAFAVTHTWPGASANLVYSPIGKRPPEGHYRKARRAEGRPESPGTEKTACKLQYNFCQNG